MRKNQYQIVVTLPKADGFHEHTDMDRAHNAVRAIREGLADRFEVVDSITIEKVPPRQERATIAIGKRVVVTPLHLAGREYEEDPYAARVCGYDMGRTKYRLDRQYSDGSYSEGGHYWTFVKQVEIHPDEESRS